MAIQYSMRYFNKDFNGRHLIVFSDHRPILGSFAKPELQAHDPISLNAINEISQFTSDIRYKEGRKILIADWLSRPSNVPIGKCYDVMKKDEIDEEDVEYVPPEQTLAALQEVAIQTLNLETIALDQQSDHDVLAHRSGHLPRNVKVAEVDISGTRLLCEVSDPQNPRPLIPAKSRNLVCNLLHHGDHPGVKESIRRIAGEYYWPGLRKDVTGFVRSCHPCQLAKQAQAINPGVGSFPLVDQRFQYIHMDIVGPLPVSNGYKYLLTCLDRCSRWIEVYPLVRDSAEEVAKIEPKR